VAKGRVADVVRERENFRQVFVEAEHTRDGAGDLRDFERVRETRAVVVALVRDEDLRLLLEAPKGVGMDDPVAVALELGAGSARGLEMQPSA
jgi:hypothetical protein